ncbi:CHAT domain-containing protein [Streptomyces mangrovi]|uniref:CHAT domain-containing protein n=1 Tax=Streptomyces mangrovi TaxID=1206892 RepID=UPI00399CE099
MSARRGREVEEQLGWLPVPRPPIRFRARLAAAGRALADYVLDGDESARRRLSDTLDRIIADRCFATAPRGFRVSLMTRSGIAHNWRGVAEYDHGEILRARDLLTAGLRLSSPDGPDRAWLEYALANTLGNLREPGREAASAAEALGYARRSVAHAAGAGDPRLVAQCRSGLALFLGRLFRAEGGLPVLNEAIGHAEWAVAAAGQGLLGPRFRYALADLLSARYDARGGLKDLDRAIELLRTDQGARLHIMAPQGKALQGTLGALLRRRYLRTRDPADLDEAVRLLKETVEEAPQPDPVGLTNLGNALLTRYEVHREPDDLLGAFEAQLRSLAARGADDRRTAPAHNNIGNALASAWRTSGDRRFGEAAVGHYRTALGLTGENAPERASREYNLASILRALGEPGEAVAAYRDAVRHGLDTSPEWALAAARQWGGWAADRHHWQEAADAYTNALEAAGRLFRIQLLREEKETWLAESQGLPAEAAHALFRAGRWKEAVVALEAGLGLLLSEALEAERIDLGRLSGTDHSDLAGRYRAAVSELEETMRRGAGPDTLRRRREAVDETAGRIRSTSGYEHFLGRPDFAAVHRSVPPGAVVVYLAAASPSGVALAVGEGGDVSAVELPSVTAAAVRRRIGTLLGARRGAPGAWRGALDAVTRWAWDAIVSPVLSIAGDRDEIVFVLSGSLVMLPLHAAWRPVREAPGSRRHLLDEHTVRYVPNARSLAVTREIAARVPADRAAVVADPEPTSWKPVGYARAETAWVRHWFPACDVLRGGEAGHAAVLEALPRARVHHFVCHGLARTDSPLRSALILADDAELTLREIMELRLTRSGAGARLAVLSACDTAVPGALLPDEVVSLPSGLIQAGVAGVVASQWAVRGEAASLLTARFYQLWRAGGLSPPAALCAAQRWLRDTTNREKAHDLAPVAALAPGDDDLAVLVRALRLRDPEARPYLHPADWAALGYHGS